MISYKQLSLAEVFTDCQEKLNDDKPTFFSLLETHIDIGKVIPISLRSHFYTSAGRTRKYSLQASLWALVVQHIFSIPTDQPLLVFLTYSKPFRDFCGFDKVPDASKITRFKQDFLDGLQSVFEHLVDLTEPICQATDSTKTDMTVFGSSRAEAFITEGNPKYANRIIKQLRAHAKSKGYDKSYDPYKAAYGAIPSHTSANPEIKQLCISGHFCYVFKFGIVTNGLGIIRHISFYNKGFIVSHPDIVVEKKTDSPNEDKSVHGSKLLVPTLKDFFAKHPLINSRVFLSDAAFNSVQLYKELLSDDIFGIDKHFPRTYIPFNSYSRLENIDYTIDDNGIPCCPHDPSLPMRPEGSTSHLRYGFPTFRFVCPKMKYIKCGGGKYHRRCQCDNPCTASPCGRMTYIYPEKDPRAFPGTIRGTKGWGSAYKVQTVVKRDINHTKANLCLAGRRTQSGNTSHTDLILTGVTQLITVVPTDKIKYHEYIHGLKPLIVQGLPTSQLDEAYLLCP